MSCKGYYLECQCDECINRETPSSAKDARIAELTAEVARYKDAIERIVENVDTSTNVQAYAQFCAYIARNALKEGK